MHGVSKRSLSAALVAVILVVLVVARYRVTVITGHSMVPTYRDGQLVLVDSGVHPDAITRGDVVVFRQGNDTLVKRVAYLPNAEVPREERRFFVSVRDLFERSKRRASADALVVPADALVVLGDNRRESEDSRAFGPIRFADVIGRVLGAPHAP